MPAFGHEGRCVVGEQPGTHGLNGDAFLPKRGQEKCLLVYIVQAVFFHWAKNVLGDFCQKKNGWAGRDFSGLG